MVCCDEEISKCSLEELINVYDNILFYVDYFLLIFIGELKSLSDVFIVMIYIFDYGELFGEYGLYFYGIFYVFVFDY